MYQVDITFGRAPQQPGQEDPAEAVPGGQRHDGGQGISEPGRSGHKLPLLRVVVAAASMRRPDAPVNLMRSTLYMP
jgi:hypothetical protein